MPTQQLAARAHSAELAAAAEQMLASCWRGANRQAEAVNLGSLRLGHAPRPCIRVGWPGLGPARPRSPQPARRCLRIGSISRRCRCSALLLALVCPPQTRGRARGSSVRVCCKAELDDNSSRIHSGSTSKDFAAPCSQTLSMACPQQSRCTTFSHVF